MKFRSVVVLFSSSCVYASLCFQSFPLTAQEVMKQRPEALRKIDVKEQLGQRVPDNMLFQNEEGKSVSLANFFNQGKPVVLVLAYYKCPMLCGLVMNAVAEVSKKVSIEMGNEYHIVTVSINPEETSKLASEKKHRYARVLGEDKVSKGWSFLVGEEEYIKTLAKMIGFEYYYDEKRKEYAHPAVLTFLSQDGIITRYLYGVEYKPNDFKLSLLEASQGKVGTIVDRIILSCYQYDPDSQSYTPFVRNIMKLGGVATIFAISIFFSFLWVKMRIAKRKNLNS